MEYYGAYLRQLNRRLLAINIVLLFFWFEHNYYSLLPETSGLLQYSVSRVSAFLAFAAWPFLLLSVGQILLNRFVYYGYDGEVRPKTFSFELTSFLKHTYLYAVAIGLLINFARYFSTWGELGYQGFAEQLGYSPVTQAVVLLIRVLTLNIDLETFTFMETLLVACTIMVLYVAQSIFVFEPLGVRDRRALPGTQRSKFKETHNALIHHLKAKGFGPRTYAMTAVVLVPAVMLGLFLTVQPPVLILFLFPVIGYLLHLALRYLHYGWDKVFNIRETYACERAVYDSREEWMDSSEFDDVWRDRRSTSLFRFQFSKENLWPMPLRVAYVGLIELVFLFVVLAGVGLLQQGTDSAFYDLVTSLKLTEMFAAVWATSGIVIKAGIVFYLVWRVFVRLRQFAFQLRYSSLNFDVNKYGTLPKFVIALLLETLFFVVVLTTAGLIMFSFHEAFVQLIFSFDIVTMLQVVYANSSWTWKAILGGYLGWRALVRIGRFKFGLFDILGGWIPNDD